MTDVSTDPTIDLLAESIERVPIDDIEPTPGNPNEGDVGAISESMDALGGFYQVVFVQRSSGRIIAGEYRWRALKAAGSDVVPVVYLDVDDEQASRILIADNEIPRNRSRVLPDALAALLEDLRHTPTGLAGTGHDDDSLQRLLASLADANKAKRNQRDPDDIPQDAPQRCEPGDLWSLGPHRLLCGDCRSAEDVARLLGGAGINLAFTSPPYADRREYDESSGFVPIRPDEYVEWYAAVSANVKAHLVADGSYFINIKPTVDGDSHGLDTELYVFDLVLAHARSWGWHYATEYCWERNGVPKQVTQRFKNQYEPIYQFALGRWKLRPEAVRHASENVPVPVNGRNGDWRNAHGRPGAEFFEQVAPGMAYPGNRLPTFMSSHEALGHAAAFPVGLPAFFVQAYTDENDNVYEPFAGSGSTLIAAEQHNRVGFAVEISPRYCDIVLARWERFTDGEAALAERVTVDA